MGVTLLYQCEKNTVSSRDSELNLRTENLDDSKKESNQGVLGVSCFDESGCEEVRIGYSFYDLHMPGTCDNFFARADIYVCDGDIVFDNFTFLPCGSYMHYLYGLSNEQADISLDSFQRAASRIYEKRYLEENVLLPPCNLAVQRASSFYNSLCYRWCLVTKGGPGEPTLQSIGKVICGNRCCVRKSDVCEDENGEVQISNVMYSSFGDSCDDIPRGTSCKGDLIGNCEHFCQ